MNFRKIVCLLLGGLFLLPSCDNDFELTSEWQAIPVVWGLINPQDTAHYIRVEKAFIDTKIDAATIASNPDSLYFDDVTVQIKRSGSKEETYTLTRVDGNLEGHVREEGTFAHMPNYLYKLKLPGNERLVSGDILNLEIKIGEISNTIEASTVVTGEYELRNPGETNGLRQVGFLPNMKTDTKWRDDEETSFLFDIVYYIHYRERLEDNTPFENKVIRWQVAKGFEVTDNPSTIKYEFDSNEFYQILSQSIEEVGSAIRRMDSVDVEIFGAGQEVLDYIKIGQANSGITSSQVIPNFTNLSEGRGLFSSTGYLFETGFRVAQTTKDSLELNIITEHLNFR